MVDRTFGSVLRQACEVRNVSLNRVAEEMMSQGAGKGAAGYLSRLQRDLNSPTQAKVIEIVDALSTVARDSGSEKDRLLSELMTAAGLGGITENSQISYLRRKAQKRLESSPDLKPYEIQTILDGISIPTMQRIIDAPEDEEISVVDLRDIATELVAKTREHEHDPEGAVYRSGKCDHTIAAGRAKILIEGELTSTQKRLLGDIANMIKTVLTE